MSLKKNAVAIFLLAAAGGCDRAPKEPSSTVIDSSSTVACGDVVGAWSSTVNGLRGRIVTSGSKPDRSSLDIFLELENVSGQEPIELHFTGTLPLGFIAFRLDDAAGTDREPDWRFGGNAPTGEARALFPAGQVIRYSVHRGTFVSMMGKRALRIGAFWGRELPSDSSKRFLRAVITAGPTHPDAVTYAGDELVRTPPRARVWSGTLDVPGVCID
jgi:hypothetical protein